MHPHRRVFALSAPPKPRLSATYPNKATRAANSGGPLDGASAAKNMRLVSFTKKPAAFDTARGLTFVNSDLAFGDKHVYQGNFAGFTVWDVSNPAQPTVVSTVSCITSQGDPSVYGNLLFISAEGGGNRNDCAKGGVTDPKDHMAAFASTMSPTRPRRA